jgi:hypothetical protein
MEPIAEEGDTVLIIATAARANSEIAYCGIEHTRADGKNSTPFTLLIERASLVTLGLPADQEDLIIRNGRGRPGADPCPVPGCPISAQEHHRLTRGLMKRLTDLQREVDQHNHRKQLEGS